MLLIDCEMELLKNLNNCWLFIFYIRKWLLFMSVFMFLKDVIYIVLMLIGGFNFMCKFLLFLLDVGFLICFLDFNGGKVWDCDVCRELIYRGMVFLCEIRMIWWMIRIIEVEKVFLKLILNYVIMCNIYVKCRKELLSKRKEYFFFL